MTQCTPTSAANELLFVRAYVARLQTGRCAGPMLTITFGDWALYGLQRMLVSDPVNDMLWRGFTGIDHSGPAFAFCAAHWFDLATLAFAQACESKRADWIHIALQLLSDLCGAARWDAKEIVNMFAWQRQG